MSNRAGIQMVKSKKRMFWLAGIFIILVCQLSHGAGQSLDGDIEGRVVKKVVRATGGSENLLKAEAWRPWERGFQKEGQIFVCDNGPDTQVQRGVSQTVTINQTTPVPIVATAFSKAEDVTGGRDNNYSLYLDLIYTDGTPLWGQTAQFDIGTHDWQKREVIIFPEKPVKTVSFHMLLRSHGGKAWFKNPQMKILTQATGVNLFDGLGVVQAGPLQEGFQVRDVGADTDFLQIQKSALGLKLDCDRKQSKGETFFDVTLTDTTGKDRAITLIYTIPVEADGLRWLDDARTSRNVEAGREYINATSFQAGANGRLCRYPFAAVANKKRGVGLGIDMAYPAFYRIGYNAGTGEMFLAYDIGLTPEKPSARLSFCKFDFETRWGFRSALDKYYDIFSDYFHCRIKEHGLWMPFARISDVKDWADFGFKFKEGTNETKWDDDNDIITFRYTEPMTWWMRMPKETPRTMAAAMDHAKTLAEKDDSKAKGFLTSGFHDHTGQVCARLLDTPWCDGAVWSMNSMPGIQGQFSDFGNKWNPEIRDRLYGPNREADLDGEYIDSSEGYVTGELDFRRDHFAAARTPLTFSKTDHKPAIFRGLIVFEYARAIAEDVHGMNKYMMANSTPSRLCWLAPMLDVMGTETDWNPGGNWRPMPDSELLYRRTMCKGKPYCFLMNTNFEDFSHELVEKYMKRCLVYGMFPGFFSHNASEGHYFTRANLYERDRGLFKRYVPLCKQLSEAGWEPVTGAAAEGVNICVERFGEAYFTVFNDSENRTSVTLTFEGELPQQCRELLTKKMLQCQNNKLTFELGAEDVAVLKF
jgi:hypothetical protein